MEHAVVGRNIPRVEGPAKVTGACLYTADLIRRDALWGGFVRSPYPHARIAGIDASRALALSGVRAVITGKDIPMLLYGLAVRDKPVLARDVVRYVGEKVAAVAAVDEAALEEALALIRVEYEELPAVFDPLEALRAGAPVIHPDYRSYEMAGIEVRGTSATTDIVGSFFGPFNMEPGRHNVQSLWRIGKGELEQGFAESDHIFEHSFSTQIVHQAFLEPRACVVEIDQEGRVDITCSNQSSFTVRKGLARYAGIAEDRIRVHPVAVGGSFGGKEGYEEVLATYDLARACGLPVKIVEHYAEELMDGEPRHAAVVKVRTGVKKDGRFWAWDGKVFYNGGAYAARTPFIANMNGTLRLAGGYRTPHVRIESFVIYTNQLPTGYFRAPGEVQTLFGVESHVDMMADALGRDRLELRLQNVVRPGDTLPSGEPLRDPSGVEVLERIAEVSGWGHARPAASRPHLAAGRGLAFGHRHIGAGETNVELFVEADGSLRLVVSVRDQGVGANTMHQQVTAEIMGTSPDRIRIDVRGTDGPYDEGVRAGRGVHIEGRAVGHAASAMIELLRRKAAAHWKVPFEDTAWQNAGVHHTGSAKRLGLQDMARLFRDEPLRTGGHFKAGKSDYYDFQAIIADVEVDQETGEIRVRQLYYVLDVTAVINPMLHQGQIEGGIIQGLGHTLMEQLVIEDGRVVNLHLGDYRIPTMGDVPPLSISLVKSKEGPGIFNAKSVAEVGISIVAPAIANAVCDATGVRIRDLPLTAEKILNGLRALQAR